MDAAAECFTLAGCYSDAAEAFAKGDKLSECLSVCRKGKLFDKGFQYIEQWKEHCNVQSKELEQIEQDFLESCASDYHERKDPKSMMKFVHAFRSMESKRTFLKSLGCLDDLLILEEESGNFLDAAELARSWGDVLKEANLLEKAGHFKDATVLLLWYVFFSSLWGNGNKGWPLKQFAENEELCEKAKSLAKIHSENFNEFVCSELEILSDQRSSLLDLKISLLVSQKNKSLRGEIFLFRKILDSHIRLNSSKYDWEDELPVDINKHCDDKTFRNQVSVRTLVYYWNAWKENVLDIFEVLESFHKEGPNEHEACVDFILNYFGVRKQCVKGNIVYILVNEHADWIRNDQKSVQKDGKLLIMNTKDLVFSMRSHWQSELVSVGINVLDTLEGLNKSKSTGSAFHRSTSLLHMFEVSKFLLDCQHVNPKDKRKLEKFLGVSSTYFDFVFPLDWRRAVCVDMISLRETDLSLNLLEEIILQNIKGGINYLAIGRVMMTCLGSRKPAALYEHITKRIQWNPAWKQCFEIFMNGGLKDVYESESLLRALDDTYRANWRCTGYMSPHSFVYLLESLLFMTSFHSRTFFTTKSSFVGWFTHIHSLSTYSAPQQIISNAINFIFEVIKQVIYNKTDTISWIEKWTTDYSHCHRLLSLKLVMMLSLICLQVPDCSQPPHFSQVLLDLLSGVNNIAYLLPKKFVYLLLRRRNGYFLNLNPELVAEAFMSIEDSLLIVLTGNASPRIRASSAVFVDLRKSKQKIMSELFPRKTVPCVQKSSNETSSSNTLPDDNLNVDPVEVQLNWQVLEDITEAINGKQEVAPNMLSAADMIKKALDQNVSTLSTALADEQFCAGKDASVVREANLAYDDLKLLSSAFGPSQKDVKHSVLIKIVQGVAERLRINRPTVDDFLKRPVMNEESKIEQMVVSESSSKTHVGQTSEEKNDVKGKGVAVENQTGGGNTQDGKNKKGKGKNKNKKGRKGKK
ncbi:putative TPR and ankyrin repeat-containing protein [Helianthus annuus]|nr:putative TPR and ankyrin repeat-containing protein [Helianthus annuus]